MPDIAIDDSGLVQTYAINDAMNQLILAHLKPRAWRARVPGCERGGRTIGAIFAHLHNCRLRWLRKSAPHLKCPAALDPHRCTMAQASTALRQSGAQCVQMLAEALSYSVGDAPGAGQFEFLASSVAVKKMQTGLLPAARTGLKTGHYRRVDEAPQTGLKTGHYRRVDGAPRANLKSGRYNAAPLRRVTRFYRDSWMPIWFPDGAMFAYMFSHEAHHRGQILMLAHQLGYRLPAKIMGGIWNWDKLWRQQGIARRHIRQL